MKERHRKYAPPAVNASLLYKAFENMSKKGTIVVLTDAEDGSVDTLISVRNMDDNFHKTFHEAVRDWNKSDDEFFDTVFEKLRKAGYEFTELEYMSEYEVVRA